MTVGASLTLGQLQAFLRTKWQLREGGIGGGGVEGSGGGGGVEGGVEGGGGIQGDSDKNIQQLKLYHTHGNNRNFIRKQSGSPVLCDTELDIVTSSASACTLHGDNGVSQTAELNVSQEDPIGNGSTTATGVNSCTHENEHLSTAQCTCTSSCSPKLEKKSRVLCESTCSSAATDTCTCVPIKCPDSQPSSDNTSDNRMKDCQKPNCKCPELTGCEGSTEQCVSAHVCISNRLSADCSRSPGSSQDYPLSDCVHEVDCNPLCNMSTLHQQVHVHVHVLVLAFACTSWSDTRYKVFNMFDVSSKFVHFLFETCRASA